jgi:hypothetical protein
MAHVKRRRRIKRLARQEYLPLAAIVLTWIAIAAAVGPADAIRLLAAVTFVRAARALTVPVTLPLVRKRAAIPEHRRDATRVALAVEAAAFPGTLAALAIILALFWWAGERQMLLLCLLFAPALPVRFLRPFTADRAYARTYRMTAGIVGLSLVGVGWLLGADVYAYALLFAAREWLALLIAYARAPQVEPKLEPVEKLRWREIADFTYATGRRRTVYRFGKVFLHALFGPFGTLVARTGRGLRLDRKFERFVPRRPAVLALVALLFAAAAAGLIIFAPEPALLFLAASLLRSAAATGNVLIWSQIAENVGEVEEVEEEEEDVD